MEHVPKLAIKMGPVKVLRFLLYLNETLSRLTTHGIVILRCFMKIGKNPIETRGIVR